MLCLGLRVPWCKNGWGGGWEKLRSNGLEQRALESPGELVNSDSWAPPWDSESNGS